MSKLKLEGGGEVDTDDVDEIKKAPGDNSVYHIFLKPTKAGRERFVGTQEDVDAIEAASSNDSSARRKAAPARIKKKGRRN